MRSIRTALTVLLAVILLAACSQESPPAAEPVKPVTTETAPLSEQTKQAAVEVQQQVKEAVAEVQQEAKKQVEAVKVETKKQVEAVKVEAKKQVEAVKAETAVVIEQTKIATIEAIDKTKVGTISALSGLTGSAPEGAQPVAAAAKAPGVVVYTAALGKVSFDHAAHAGRLDCSKCHPTSPPQTIAIAKEIAHTLCKGCHQNSGGKAPTACVGCHKK